MKQSRFQAVVLILPLFAAGCMVVDNGSNTQEQFARTVDLKGAKTVHLTVQMGAGQLKMRGGASPLMDAEFRYRTSHGRPEVAYDVNGARGSLTVKQPEHHSMGGNNNDIWDLRLNEDVPIDITVKIGAGEGRLDLGTVALHDLDIEMGAGELKLDLTGHPRNDVDVRIRGGVGEATVHLPRRARLDVEAHGGIGEINVHGLTKRGDRWVNEPPDAQSTMHVSVNGGIGGINLICE